MRFYMRCLKERRLLSDGRIRYLFEIHTQFIILFYFW